MSWSFFESGIKQEGRDCALDMADPGATVTTTYEEFPDLCMRVKTTTKKTGGRTDVNRDIDVDLEIDVIHDDSDVDFLDYTGVSEAMLDLPVFKKIVELDPNPNVRNDILSGLDAMWDRVREQRLEAIREERENAAVELEAEMEKQAVQMRELCPDGNYSEYTAYLEQGDWVYIFVEPHLYVKVHIPPS